MKVSGRRRLTVPAARPFHPPAASSCTGRSVWALSHGRRAGELPRRSWGGGGEAALVGICKVLCAFFFFLPLSSFIKAAC